jgi:hypothetical protein
MEGRVCYWISPAQCGSERIVPSVVRENEAGHTPTDWEWGSNYELAQEVCRKKNEAMGLTAEDVDQIVTSSMFSGAQ